MTRPSTHFPLRQPSPPPGGIMGRPPIRGVRPITLVTWLMAKDVAKMFGVSKMTIYRLIHAGELPATKVGRSFRIQQEHAEAFLRDSSTVAD